jgi:hypothetical protein
VSATLPRPPEIDAGVVREARRRRRRRRAGLVLAGVAAVAIAGGALAGGGGGGGRARHGFLRGGYRPPQLTYRHGVPYLNGQVFPVSVLPAPYAGMEGLQISAAGTGSAGGLYPPPTQPVYSSGSWSPEVRTGPYGEIDYLFVRPMVARVRVPGLGVFTPAVVPGLPPGDRIVVFRRPPGSPGTIIEPDVTDSGVSNPVVPVALDAAGRPLREGHVPEGGASRPVTYWQAPSRQPAASRCVLSGPSLQVQWGEAVESLAGSPSLTPGSLLSCENLWYANGVEVVAFVNARSPGAPPPPLWGTHPVAPGVVQIDATPPFSPSILARRAGPAWLTVWGGGSLAQQLAVLRSLRLRLRA